MQDDNESMDNTGRRDAMDPCKQGRVSGSNFSKRPTSGSKRTLDVPEHLSNHPEPVGRPRSTNDA